MNFSPKISIIVPVYKVEKYLRRCLDSIVAQTFTDWECILVDDGSPDNSGEICDEYAQKDYRFKVIHQENKGVSAARNKGLDEAKGEWIGFVDSDDWIEKETYEVAYSKAVKEGVDLIQWGVFIEFTDRISKVAFKEKVITYSDAVKYWFPSMWHKLVLRKLIYDNNITFPVGIKISEDRIFAYQCYMNAKKSLSIKDCFYHYMMNGASVTHNMTEDMLRQEEKLLRGFEEELIRKNIKMNDFLLFIKVETKIRTLIKLSPPNFDLCRNIFSEVNNLFICRKTVFFTFVFVWIYVRMDFIARLLIWILKKRYL